MVESENLRKKQQQEQPPINPTLDHISKAEPIDNSNILSHVIKEDQNTVDSKSQNLNGSSKDNKQQLRTKNRQQRGKRNRKANYSFSNSKNQETTPKNSRKIPVLIQKQNNKSSGCKVLPNYLIELSNTLKNKQQFDQIFSSNALFHSSNSLLTKIDLKSLFQPLIYETLPRQSQLKLIKLLPECDRIIDSFGSFKLNTGALNNEFIKKSCIEWQKKLSGAEFGNFNTNKLQDSNFLNHNNLLSTETFNEKNLLNTTQTITRSTRLRQQKLLQSLR